MNCSAIHLRSNTSAATPDRDWATLISHSSMQQLQECRLDDGTIVLTAALVNALTCLPQLCSLSVCCPEGADTDTEEGMSTHLPWRLPRVVLLPLVIIPSLRHLTCTVKLFD